MRIRNHLNRALALLTFISVLLTTWAARASFSPINCQSAVQVNITFSSTDPQQLDPQPSNNCDNSSSWGTCPHYQNSIGSSDWQRAFITNQYVNSLAFHFTLFKTESSYDLVFGRRWNATSSSWDSLVYSSGVPVQPFTWTLSTTGTSSFLSTPAAIDLNADLSVTGSGITVDYLTASCGTGNDATVYRNADIGERISGILLGTGDTTYTAFVPAPNGQTNPPDHASIALWGDSANATGADFDLYARCGAFPTATTADAVGYRTGTTEFVHLTNTNCPQGSTWYIAVNSYSGQGAFNLMPSAHYSSHHYDVDVGMAAGSGSAVYTDFNSYWEQWARQVYGASKGAEYIATVKNHATHEPSTSDGRCGSPLVGCASMIDLANTGGQTRNTSNGAATPKCYGGGGACVSYVGQLASASIAVHEYSHRTFDQPDEYCCSPNQPTCGYTIMAVDIIRPHNFCFDNNHNVDPGPGGAGIGSAHSAWYVLNTNGITSWAPSRVPDAYNFTDFDFVNSGVTPQVGHVTNPN